MIAKPLELAFQAMLELENNLIKQGLSHDQFNDLHDAFCCLEEAINKAPVAKPWQSVTPDEVHEAFNFVELVKHLDFDEQRQAWCEAFAAYIEAKLKEKNT